MTPVTGLSVNGAGNGHWLGWCHGPRFSQAQIRCEFAEPGTAMVAGQDSWLLLT